MSPNAPGNSDQNSIKVAWDNYWSGAASTGKPRAHETDHPAFRGLWSEFFSSVAQPNLKLLDIASGDGIVPQVALDSMAAVDPRVTCCDSSQAALSTIENQLPNIQTRCCDAADLPFGTESFDLVTSQFGIEYATHSAIQEACRVLKPGGGLQFILHLHGGDIYQKCQANRNAAEEFIASQFVEQAISVVDILSRKQGSSESNKKIPLEVIKPGIEKTVKIVNRYGRHVTDGTIDTIFMTVSRIFRNPERFDLTEARNWLEAMHKEMPGYVARMRSMCEASMTTHDVELLAKKLQENLLEIEIVKTVFLEEHSNASAWLIRARKQNNDE